MELMGSTPKYVFKPVIKFNTTCNMEEVPHRRELSHWFRRVPWDYQGFYTLIITFFMITLWVLLLFFNVNWLIIFLPVIILAIPLSRWSWYQAYQADVIPTAVIPAVVNNTAVNSAAFDFGHVRIFGDSQ